MKKHYEGNIICKVCKKIVPKMNSNHKYCAECADDKRKENMRRYMKKRRMLNPDIWKKYKGLYAENRKVVNGVRRPHGKKVICNRCNELKVHDAKGLCYKCYSDWHNELVRGPKRNKISKEKKFEFI